jgi:holo-[acyl-carrier protein] synthase
MIVGVGIDIVDLSRIDRLLQEYGDQFARRILAPTEQPAFAESSRQVLFLANRFAAKEALSKALGTGLRYPVTLQAISVSNDGVGKPTLGFHGPLPDYLTSRGVARHHLSLSHEKGMTCAVVILEQ